MKFSKNKGEKRKTGKTNSSDRTLKNSGPVDDSPTAERNAKRDTIWQEDI